MQENEKAQAASVHPIVHTPGPWSYSEQAGGTGHCYVAQVWDSFGDSLAVIETTEIGEKATATARLIAAAPDLLQACELLLMLSLPRDISGMAMVDVARQTVIRAKGLD